MGRFLRVALGVAVVVGAAACGRTGLLVLGGRGAPDDGGATEDAPTEADDSSSNPGDVSGRVIVDYSTDQGIVERGLDLSGSPVDVFVENGNGFAVVHGSGHQDGGFVVSPVPAVPFQLRIGQRVFVDPPREFTVHVAVAGRPDASTPLPGSNVILDVDNLSPLQQAPFELVVVSSNAGVFGLISLPGSVPVGTTTLSGVGAYAQTNTAIDGTRGDDATLVQYARAGATLSVVRALDVPSPELKAGPPSHIKGTFADVVAGRQVATTLDAASFQQLLSGFPQGSQPTSWNVDVRAVANAPPPALSEDLSGIGAATPNEYVRTGVISVSLAATTSDPLLGGGPGLSFGNPLPGWALWAGWTFDVRKTVTLPSEEGGTISAELGGSFSHSAALEAFNAPARPTLTPPGHVLINGADAYVVRQGVGKTPVLTWDASSSLDPNFDGGTIVYDVFFQPVLGPGDSCNDSCQVSFRTSQPRLAVPPGLLPPAAFDGRSLYYQAYVEARAVAGSDPANPASDSATAITAPFMP
jgi:hypothetical protein